MTNQRRYTPKLRLLSAVLSAAMALTMLPMAAFAEDATDYGVRFAGEKVTSANAGDILGDGKASYDPDTQTVRLDGDISTPNNGVQTNLPVRIAGTGTITGQDRTGPDAESMLRPKRHRSFPVQRSRWKISGVVYSVLVQRFPVT